MELIDYLKCLGLSDSDAKQVYKLTTSRNIEIIKKKVDYYKETFKLSNQRIARMIRKFPPLIGLGVTESNDDNKLIITNESQNIRETMEEKVTHLSNVLNISFEEIINMAYKHPQILAMSINTVDERLEDYSILLSASKEQITNMFTKYPVMICFDTKSNNPKSVRDKIKDLKKILSASDEEIGNLIKKKPSILGYDTKTNSPTSIKGKLESLQELFLLPEKDIQTLVKSLPVVLSYDIMSNTKTSVKTKLDYLKTFMSTSEIVSNSKVLTFPALRVKSRFLILATFMPRGKIVEGKHLMTSEQTLFARMKYLENGGASLKYIRRSNNEFEKIFGVKVEDLIEQYPINEEDLHKLEDMYFVKHGRDISLDKYEIQEVLQST